MNAKYPKTPYWPWSPSIGRDDAVHPDPSRFVGEPAELKAYAKEREIPVVPVLFKGRFRSVREIRTFMERAHGEPSMLGGEREGMVLRLARRFPPPEFPNNLCKSVRAGHVQSDEHWTRNWRPCRILQTSK